MELRSRLSFSLEEVQTAQSHAIMGTPLLVPVPRKVMVSGGAKHLLKLMNPFYRWEKKNRYAVV
jgi:hypothetical protein